MRRQSLRGAIGWGAALLLSLAACGPEPTPFPVELPATPTPTPAPEALPPLRYALAPEAAAAVPDLAALQNGALVLPLLAEPDPAALGADFDVLVGWGSAPPDSAWQPGALTPALVLVIDPAQPPLSDPALAALLLAALDVPAALAGIDGAQALHPPPGQPPAALRTALANAGYPDGIGLSAAVVAFPGVDVLSGQMAAAGFAPALRVMSPGQARAALDAGQVQMALLVTALDDEPPGWQARYGPQAVVTLGRVPVRYQVAPGLSVQVSYTAEGLPLFRR